MQTVTLYKHQDGLFFDDINKIVLFQQKQGYMGAYADYCAPAEIWTGQGKTFNNDIEAMLEIPSTALLTGSPVYVRITTNEQVRYYYINAIELLPQKAMLSLTLDTFATYYEAAQLDTETAIVKKSTCRLNLGRIIPLSDEITPLNKSQLGKAIIANNISATFVLKIKVLTARSISSQAYTTRLYGYEVSLTQANPRTALENAFDYISNIYEIESTVEGFGLDVQIEEAYLLPSPLVFLGTTYNFRYISPDDASKQMIALKLVRNLIDLPYDLRSTYTNYNKIIIGENEINLPAYYDTDLKLTIQGVYNITDFDILLKYSTNEPITIKDYFRIEVANTTQETSLQKLSRIGGYLTAILGAAVNTGISYGASGGNAGMAGITAAQSFKGAGANIGASLIAEATKEAMPSTRFISTALSVFVEGITRRLGWIYQEYYSNENSQAMNILRQFGVETYSPINSLEAIREADLIVPDGRRYAEIQANFTGIPLNYSQELTQYLAGGVEIVEG